MAQSNALSRPKFAGGARDIGFALGIGDLHLPLGWGDLPFEALFDEIEVMPGTALIMEIGERFAAERADSLERARALAARVNARHAAAAA